MGREIGEMVVSLRVQAPIWICCFFQVLFWGSRTLPYTCNDSNNRASLDEPAKMTRGKEVCNLLWVLYVPSRERGLSRKRPSG